MSKKYFKAPLREPDKNNKVYRLTDEDINEIVRLRELKTELDPGMGGVSPKVLTDLLETSSELVSVDIALTSACNLRCVHCYRPSEEWDKLLIDFNTVTKIIEQSLMLGVRFFILTGGEPLMYSSSDNTGKEYSYFDVVDKIQEVYGRAGVPVKVLTFTDVALIDENAAKMLAERKVGLCLKRDTLDHDIQDGIAGVPGASKDIEKGYENLFKAGYGKDPSLAVSVNQVLRKGKFDTLKDSIELHRWVRSNGMEHSVVPIHYCGEAIDEAQEDGIHPLEVKALYDIMAEIDRTEFNDQWTVYSAFPKNKTCNRPGRGVHIRATGKVTACSESPLIDPYVYGDINKENLTDIVNSERFKKFRSDFDKREGKYICNADTCDLNKNFLCRGGCATRSAFSRINPDTGLIEQNTNMLAYSEGREDPLCPAWVVLAQRQGILEEGLYEEVVDRLLKDSLLSEDAIWKIKDKVVGEFNKINTAVLK
ncbi:MAG: radical SAM protein [Armatimonadota bacterium]